MMGEITDKRLSNEEREFYDFLDGGEPVTDILLEIIVQAEKVLPYAKSENEVKVLERMIRVSRTLDGVIDEYLEISVNKEYSND